MTLSDLSKSRRDAILDEPFASVAATYPSATSAHLKTSPGQFQTPVRSPFKRSSPVFLAVLQNDSNEPTLAESIKPVIDIRTVQASGPLQVVAFCSPANDQLDPTTDPA